MDSCILGVGRMMEMRGLERQVWEEMPYAFLTPVIHGTFFQFLIFVNEIVEFVYNI